MNWSKTAFNSYQLYYNFFQAGEEKNQLKGTLMSGRSGLMINNYCKQGYRVVIWWLQLWRSKTANAHIYRKNVKMINSRANISTLGVNRSQGPFRVSYMLHKLQNKMEVLGWTIGQGQLIRQKHHAVTHLTPGSGIADARLIKAPVSYEAAVQ